MSDGKEGAPPGPPADTKDAIPPVPPLPPVPVSELPPAGGPIGGDESTFFHQSESRRLDLSVRRWASFGALGAAAVLYIAGLCAMVMFLEALIAGCIPVAAWPFYVTTVVALFAIPTGLVVGVLRSNSRSYESGDEQGLTAAIGSKVLDVLSSLLTSGKP